MDYLGKNLESYNESIEDVIDVCGCYCWCWCSTQDLVAGYKAQFPHSDYRSDYKATDINPTPRTRT